MFQIVNHEIPSDVIRKLQNVGKEFFELPQEEKEEDYLFHSWRSQSKVMIHINWKTNIHESEEVETMKSNKFDTFRIPPEMVDYRWVPETFFISKQQFKEAIHS